MVWSLWDLIHRPATLCRYHFYKIVISIIVILLASQYMFNIFVYQSTNYFSFNISSWPSLYSRDMTNKLSFNPSHLRTKKLDTASELPESGQQVTGSSTLFGRNFNNVTANNNSSSNNATSRPSGGNSSGGILMNGTLLLHPQQPLSNSSSVQNRTEVSLANSTSKPTSLNATAMTPLSLCPVIPPKLVGPVKVWTEAPTFEELEKMHPELEIGGRFRPKECVSRHKVAIIIPYRDREEHLRLFLHNLHPILQRQQLDYGIYVIEQKEKTKFNRAKLMNVGFAESLKQYDYQCFVFHDVDLLPEDDRNLYSCPEQPRHMSVAIDTFKYKLPYDKLFGGVSALSKAHMEKINGFSNQFWGWGGEDDDMANRIIHHGYHISRYPLNIARYKMLKHKKDNPNPDRYKMLYKGKLRYKSDGINSLHYKRVDILLKRLYTWVYVDLEQP